MGRTVSFRRFSTGAFSRANLAANIAATCLTLRAFVTQFDSEAGATDAVDLLYTDGLEPCPDTCAFDIVEFDVDGIPNAKGVQRIATQEALDQVGDDRPPHAEYMIFFADGPFAYRSHLFGPPDDVSERRAREIATRLYDRVQGLPHRHKYERADGLSQPMTNPTILVELRGSNPWPLACHAEHGLHPGVEGCLTDVVESARRYWSNRKHAGNSPWEQASTRSPFRTR